MLMKDRLGTKMRLKSTGQIVIIDTIDDNGLCEVTMRNSQLKAKYFISELEEVSIQETQERIIENVDDTLKERGARYGTLTDNGVVAQSLKDIFRKASSWRSLPLDTREALDIIASKISRVLTGHPDYADNFHDIAGYALLVERRILEDESRKPK